MQDETLLQATNFPTKPKLGGGITPQDWLRSGAALDNYGQANMRAREARAISHYISLLEAQVRQLADDR